MFTRTEKNFLVEPSSFSKRRARQYRYTIKKRVQRCLDDLNLAIQNNDNTRLDLIMLKSELEKILDLLSSVDMTNDARPSSHVQTFSNPYSAANSNW